MSRRPYERSAEFGARFQAMLARAGVPRQRVARHLEKAYESTDFRAWEGRLMRYAAGLVPKSHELEAVLRALVWPAERLPDVTRWLREGGDVPDFAVTLGDGPAHTPLVAPANMDDASDPRRSSSVASAVAQPFGLRSVLESVRSGAVSIDDAETTIRVLARIARSSSSAIGA